MGWGRERLTWRAAVVWRQIARERDPTITDERARSALGALGLTGESVLRPIKALSGQEEGACTLFRVWGSGFGVWGF